MASPAFAKSIVAYPNSFRELLLAGFAMIVLPLIGVLGWATWSTREYLEQSHEAVILASQVERASRSFANRASSIERLALRLAISENKELRADYDRVRSAFNGVHAELVRFPLGDEPRVALKMAMEQERELHRLLTSGELGGQKLREIGERSAELSDRASGVLAMSFLAAEREVERLQESARVIQGKLIAFVLFGALASLVILLALTRQIARPIAELESAIRNLGSGDFARSIHVSGPKDLRSIGVRLDWLRRRLLELGAEKNRFLRHLSHELNTPLAAVREGSELLNDEVAGPLSARQRQVVSILRGNSRKLQRLIEDLLDHQRALHGAATLHLERVNLHELIQDISRGHELAAIAKGQRLTFEMDHIALSADREKLCSIMDNLIGNAVKYCPPGGTIGIVAKRIASRVTIDVCDTGPGILHDERDTIFESFCRGSAGSGGQVRGTGLGLAIVREYVEAHGGRVHIVEDGLGGHFRVTIPIELMLNGT